MNSTFGSYGAGRGSLPGLHPVGNTGPERSGGLWWDTATVSVYNSGPSYAQITGRNGALVQVLAQSSTAFFLSDGYAVKKSAVPLLSTGVAGKPGGKLWQGMFHKITGPKAGFFRPKQKPKPQRGTPNVAPGGFHLPKIKFPNGGGIATQPPAVGYPPIVDGGYPIQPLPSPFQNPSNGPTDSGASSGEVVTDDSQAVSNAMAEETPFYKNPMVLIGAAVLAGGAYLFLKSKKGKGGKKHKKHKEA